MGQRLKGRNNGKSHVQHGTRATQKGTGQAHRTLSTHKLIITQLHTGKIGMAHYLHAIGRAESPRCPCGTGIQTVRHVLLECPRTRDLQEELLGRASDMKKILRDSALAKAAAILMLRSNLLGQFQAVQEAPEDLAPQDAA